MVLVGTPPSSSSLKTTKMELMLVSLLCVGVQTVLMCA